jgi:hypothetical protein
MHLILLHGASGIWDEVVCLVIPATAIMGVALAVLREKPNALDETSEAAADAESAEDAAEDAPLVQAPGEGR